MRTTRRQIADLARTALVWPLVGCLAAGPAVAWANPELQEVVSGQVEMNGPDQVDVTNGSIANYQHFDIGVGESFRVQFTDGDGGNHLARVVNGIETRILGGLSSNGHVYLANPAGILVGPGGSIDMAGFHAAAGDIQIGGRDGYGPRADDIDGSNRYQNLTGTVRNLGRINAAVVDLVGRYVENAGVIANGNPADPLDGYFVVAVGEDVLIRRIDQNITLRIERLAERVIDAMGQEQDDVGVVLASSEGGVIDAGAEGEIAIGAGIDLETDVELGAGDLFGAAIDFGAGTTTRARTVDVFARGGDVVIGEAGAAQTTLAASDLTICSGEICGGGTPIPDDETLRAGIDVEGPTRIELVPVADPDGADDVLGTRDDEAARVELVADDELDFEVGPDKLEIVDAGTPGDIELRAAGGIRVAGSISAREFSASATRTDTLEFGVPTLTGDVTLEDGVSIATESTSLEGIEVVGVAGASLASQDVRSEVDESLAIVSGAALTIDAAWADALSGARDVTVSSFREVDVGDAANDVALEADRLVLRSGISPAGGDLVIGAAPDEDGNPPATTVALRADAVTLSAAAEDVGPINPEAASRVVVHDNATLSDRSGGRLPEFTLIQEASIDADDMPSVDQLGGPGSEAYSRSFVSEVGLVSFTAAEADKLGLETIEVGDEVVRRDDLLSLQIDGDGGSVVNVNGDLELGALSVGRGSLRRDGLPPRFNVLVGDVTTEGDLKLIGDTDLFDLQDLEAGEEGDVEGERDPQRLESRSGRVEIPSIEKQRGSLEIAAGGPADENPPILIEGDVELFDGNLTIEDPFELRSSRLAVAGPNADQAENGQERGVLTFVGDGELGDVDQTFEARRIVVGDGVLLQKSGGSLTMLASNLDPETVIEDPSATIEIGGEIRIDPAEETEDDEVGILPVREIAMVAGGEITVSGDAHLVADRISLSGGLAGGDLQGVVLTDQARLHADAIRLEAGLLGLESGPEDTSVSVGSGVELRDREGAAAPDNVQIRQGGELTLADLPTLTQMGVTALAPDADPLLYQVEAAKSGLVLDAALAAELLAGSAEQRAAVALELSARDDVRVESGGVLNAAFVEIASGTDNSGDLVLAQGARVEADRIALTAGTAAGGSAGGQIVLEGDVELRATDGVTAPEQFAFSQGASIDGTTTIVSATSFGPDANPERTQYTLESTGGAVTLGDATIPEDPDAGTPEIVIDGVDVATLVRDGIDLTVNSDLDLEVVSDVEADSLVLRSRNDVLVGFHQEGDDLLETPALEVRADALEFNADAGAAEGAVEIADGVQIRGRSQALPGSLALRQGNEIDDDVLPSLDQFGSPSDLSGMSYEIASFLPVTLTDATRIAGADLTLISAQTATLDTGAPLALGSLRTCDRECETNSGASTDLALLQDVHTQTGIELSGSVVLAGGSSRSLTAVSGGIAIGGDVEYRGGDLTIDTWSGDVAIAGTVDTSAALPPFPPVDEDGQPVDPPDVHGGDVLLAGDGVRVERVLTGGSAGLTSGDITILARSGDVALTGDSQTLDARAAIGGTAGDIDVSGVRILIGDEGDAGAVEAELFAGDVRLAGDVVASRPPREELEVPEGDPPELGPLAGRVLEIGADGAVEITGDVTIDELVIQQGPDPGALAPTSVALRGALTIDNEAPPLAAPSGTLRVRSRGEVALEGDVVATQSAELVGSRIVLGTDLTPIQVDSPGVELRATGATAGIEAIDLDNVSFLAPGRFEITQEAGFDETQVRDLIAQIGGVAPGVELGIRSTEETVRVDAVDVADLHLGLGGAGADGITVTGDLDVRSLDLDGSARVLGDLTVRSSRGQADSPLAGLQASGDLRVEGGDLTSYTVARFDGGDSDQLVWVDGVLRAPSVDREGVLDPDTAEATLTLQAGGGVSLLGSLGARDFSTNLESAGTGQGAGLTFASDVTALGDVGADRDVDFQDGVRLTRDHELLAFDGSSETVQVGLDQVIESRSGNLEIENTGAGLLDKQTGDLRIAGVTYEIGGAFDADGERFAVRTGGDLALAGDGVLTGAGDSLAIASTGGKLTLEGSLTTGSGLVVEAADVIETRAAGVAGGATLTAESIELRSDVLGTGDLTLDAAETHLTSSDAVQRIEVASLAFNPDGREDVPVAATISREGDLQLVAAAGDFRMGKGEKLTATGELEIRASGKATLSDLGAMKISVKASEIGIAERKGGKVLLPGGTTVRDGGVDVVANRIDFSQTPSGNVTIGTPTTNEVSQSLNGDRVLSRAIFPDLRKLTASDFACAGGLCDLVAQGSPIVESSRYLEGPPPGEGPADYQLLREENLEGVSARPLWGQELLAYLEQASIGGDRVQTDFDDPRLQLPPVQKALRIYRGVFAPTEVYDPETGARLARSHEDRIRQVLQEAEDEFVETRSEPLTGDNYLAFVAMGTRHGEAMFYLSAIVDLAREAEAAGVRGQDLRGFVYLLLEGIAPERLGVEALGDALPLSG